MSSKLIIQCKLLPNEKLKSISCKDIMYFTFIFIYAEVVTFVAGSLEAGGLPGSLEIPEVLK